MIIRNLQANTARAITTFAALFLFLITSPSPAQTPGALEFRERCAGCHGLDGRGGERAPTAQAESRSDEELRDLIQHGLPARGMPAFPVSDDVLKNLLSFVRSVTPHKAASLRPIHLNVRSIDFAELANPKPGSWLSYNGSLGGNRYSGLTEIGRKNVAGLGLRWIYSLSGSDRLEVTPVVADGVMYVTSGRNECLALDAGNGKLLWKYAAPGIQGGGGDGGGVNRGVAILGTRVFMETSQAHLIALDRATGNLLWDVSLGDPQLHYEGTSAPLIVKNLVIAGLGGGEYGIRGLITAHSPETGKEVWRVSTLPDQNDPAIKTWSEPAILGHGGSATWLTGSYDPSLDLIYWATGNPCPDFNGDHRKGDNLYSDSVLALRPADGHREWFYQFTPHDTHDWDAQETLMVVDAPFRGEQRKLLVQANRNGFFYVLDRTNGKLLVAKSFVKKMTWASGVGADGRPQLLPEAEPSVAGTLVCPSIEGGNNYMSTAYSPETRLFYVMALDKCSLYKKAEDVFQPGKAFEGTGSSEPENQPGKKFVRAINVDTGDVVWEFPEDGDGMTWGGLLSTAGGLVFFADDNGDFAALDAKTGKRLWRFTANQFWKASPMTFTAGGQQFVAIAGGSDILVFGLQ